MNITPPYQLIMLAIAVLSLGCAARASADDQPADSHWREAFHRQIAVDCDRGQKLADAVASARAGTEIVVAGTCREQVLVGKNQLHIRGRDGAIIDGGSGGPQLEGVLTIAGARGVVVSNLTVQNGPDQGLVVQRNAQVALIGVQATGNASTGVTVDASYVELTDVSANGNGAGFDIFTGASAIALGNLTAIGNGGSGLAINGNSCLELRGSVVETSANGGDGITLVNDADLLILSFPESQGSGVRAADNRGAAGIFVANSSIAVVGSQFFGSGANFFDISGHGVGMLLISSNVASPFGTARFDIAANGAGIIFTDGTDAVINGGLNVHDNFGPGIVADAAGVIRLQPNPTNPSSVTDNAVDLSASFGSRIVIDAGVEIGSVNCDETVLASAGACE